MAISEYAQVRDMAEDKARSQMVMQLALRPHYSSAGNALRRKDVPTGRLVLCRLGDPDSRIPHEVVVAFMGANRKFEHTDAGLDQSMAYAKHLTQAGMDPSEAVAFLIEFAAWLVSDSALSSLTGIWTRSFAAGL